MGVDPHLVLELGGASTGRPVGQSPNLEFDGVLAPLGPCTCTPPRTNPSNFLAQAVLSKLQWHFVKRCPLSSCTAYLGRTKKLPFERSSDEKKRLATLRRAMAASIARFTIRPRTLRLPTVVSPRPRGLWPRRRGRLVPRHSSSSSSSITVLWSSSSTRPGRPCLSPTGPTHARTCPPGTRSRRSPCSGRRCT